MSPVHKSRRGRAVVRAPRRTAFTLIELLVVVAILALLMSILLPSLSRARAQAQAAKCGANLSSVGKAVHGYLAESGGVFPLSYAYAYNEAGDVDLNRQPISIAFGYVHWSWSLFDSGKVPDDAFTCPSMPNRGHPRTYPGPNPDHWEEEQVDHQSRRKPGGNASGYVTDRQAPRMAYTAHAAIMPRNKLGSIREGVRENRFARESEIHEAGRTIMVTEFNRNWKIVSWSEGGGYISKSHRPVNPFYNEMSGYQEYDLPKKLGLYRYWPSDKDKNYGLFPLQQLEDTAGMADQHTFSEVNYIGRHHPGGDRLGGSANFLYVDGHVARKAVLATLQYREWGKAYYGIDGNNACDPKAYEYLP
jgi:prepilin-type N-terminal cleavage/methylation domain-containing protein/prepilin-type processing-associated H-X9-DG protein